MDDAALYHTPVLLNEVIDNLLVDDCGTYLDCTLGGGGHFLALCSRLHTSATLIGIDRDAEAIAWVKARLPAAGPRIFLEQARFSTFDAVLKKHNIGSINGLLLDLGISSRHIDSQERGFSYRGDVLLDMRMDLRDSITAASLLNKSDLDYLEGIFSQFGEIENAKRMARTIERYRSGHPLLKTSDLIECLESEYGKPLQYKLLSRIYQALRIAVNDELGELRECLEKSTEALVTGGRMAVIAYHSLEDRIVKRFFTTCEKSCTCDPKLPLCICNTKPVLKRITRKPVRPSEQECIKNPRSRSALLRVAERV